MQLSLIQIPYDSGQFNKRMGCGPIHLIEDGLMDWLKSKGHEVQLHEVRLPEEFLSETGAVKNIQGQAKQIIEANIKEGSFPIILSGNCNYAAFGTMSALPQNKTGVLWFDAHGDFNSPETSSSGFFDGMALNVLTGNSWKALSESMNGFKIVDEENVILIGARDLDKEEEILLNKSKIKRINTEDIRNKSNEIFADKFFQPLSEKVQQIYLHIDLDVIDKDEFKANQFAASGGLKINELTKIIKAAKLNFKIAALSLAAYEPGCDKSQIANEVVHEIIETVI